jgi:AraC-like DNA-binding protein
VRDEQHEVAPGQLAVILPHEPHRYGACDDRPWTIYWCHAAGRVAHRLGGILRSEFSSPVLDVGDQSRLIRLFEEITAELEKGYGVDHLIQASMTLAHLLGLAMAIRRPESAHASASLRVQGAIRYMNERKHEQIRIPEIAGMFNLSASHFCAVFKKATGFPPLDYFVRLKLRSACELLDGSRLPVKEIADELGFADALYFSRVFHKVYGMSPTEYRNTVKG